MSTTWWLSDMMGKGCGQPRIKARETLEMTSKFWARITVRPGCHSRNKELWRGTGFVGEMMSSVRDCWIWGNGKTFKWKGQVGSQRYGNKPWARVRTWAVNLWVISPMCLHPWEADALYVLWAHQEESKTKDRALGNRGHEKEQEPGGKLQENWKVSRQTKRV